MIIIKCIRYDNDACAWEEKQTVHLSISLEEDFVNDDDNALSIKFIFLRTFLLFYSFDES